MGVVYQKLSIHAKLLVENILVHLGDSAHVVHAVFRKTARNAASDVPEIGYRAVRPQLFAEFLLVEPAYVIRDMLRGDIQRDFCKEQIGPDSGGGADVGFFKDRVHQGLRELLRSRIVHGEVRRCVDEAFVDGVNVDILRADVPEVHSVHLRRYLHVPFHARKGGDVLDAGRNLEYTAAVTYPQSLHRWGYR